MRSKSILKTKFYNESFTNHHRPVLRHGWTRPSSFLVSLYVLSSTPFPRHFDGVTNANAHPSSMCLQRFSFLIRGAIVHHTHRLSMHACHTLARRDGGWEGSEGGRHESDERAVGPTRWEPLLHLSCSFPSAYPIDFGFPTRLESMARRGSFPSVPLRQGGGTGRVLGRSDDSFDSNGAATAGVYVALFVCIARARICFVRKRERWRTRPRGAPWRT